MLKPGRVNGRRGHKGTCGGVGRSRRSGDAWRFILYLRRAELLHRIRTEVDPRFVLYHNKRHRDMGAAEVEAFLTHLAAAKRVSLFRDPWIMFFPILRGQWWLFLGACVSLAIALLHVVVVLIGPDAYRFFGGPGLARQAESGSWQPALMTLVLAWLFVVFAAYGLSGAGLMRRACPCWRACCS